jgi:hypothetical protein
MTACLTNICSPDAQASAPSYTRTRRREIMPNEQPLIANRHTLLTMESQTSPARPRRGSHWSLGLLELELQASFAESTGPLAAIMALSSLEGLEYESVVLILLLVPWEVGVADIAEVLEEPPRDANFEHWLCPTLFTLHNSRWGLKVCGGKSGFTCTTLASATAIAGGVIHPMSVLESAFHHSKCPDTDFDRVAPANTIPKLPRSGFSSSESA